MALFSDKSLPKSLPSPLANSSQAAKRSTPSFGAAPNAIPDSAIQTAVNNQLAAGAGQERAALMDSNRAGMSLGKGQKRMADMSAAAADAQARATAASTEMGAAAANSAAQRDYDTTMRGEQLGNAGLLERLRNANSMERIQKKNWNQDLYEAMRRGRFGMDSIYLDKTPLIESLLRD